MDNSQKGDVFETATQRIHSFVFSFEFDIRAKTLNWCFPSCNSIQSMKKLCYAVLRNSEFVEIDDDVG